MCINDGIATVGRGVRINLGASVNAEIEGSASLDGRLVKLDISDRVARCIGQRSAQAGIAQDAQGASTLDAPSTDGAGGGIGVVRISQNEHARAELHQT